MPFGLGVWEVVILAGILVLLFGAKGLPSAARSLGRSLREVQSAVSEVDPRRLLEGSKDEAPSRPASAAPDAPTAAERPPSERA